MRLSYASRFWLYAPLTLFLALAAWVMAYWWIVAGALDKKLTALNGQEALPEVTLSWSSKTISGFPFNIDILFTDLVVQGEGAHGPFRWSTQKLALHRLTYGRPLDLFEAAGQQGLDWTDAKGNHHSSAFLPGILRASALRDAKGLARLDLDMKGAGGKIDGAPVSAERIQLHLRRDPKADALDIMLDTDNARDGNAVSSLSAYLVLTPGTAWAPLLAGNTAWSDAAKAWQTQGGSVTPAKTASAGAFANATSLLSPLY